MVIALRQERAPALPDGQDLLVQHRCARQAVKMEATAQHQTSALARRVGTAQVANWPFALKRARTVAIAQRLIHALALLAGAGLTAKRQLVRNYQQI